MSAHQTHPCPTWLAGFLDNPFRLLLTNPNSVLKGLVAEGQTALDLGCGPGVFTEGLARLVGPQGKVVAVDLQQGMLDRARARLKRAGLQDRALFERCSPDRIGLQDFNARADFALAFWMVHEVPDPDGFLAEVCVYLKPSGRLLIVEPRLHVIVKQFQHTLDIAARLGLIPLSHPRVAISQAVLFLKP